MKTRMAGRVLLAIAMCIAALSISACASRPGMEGGIVGTGNRIDCSNRDSAQGPVPKECEPGAR